MYGIDILVKEHEVILEYTKVLRTECTNILNGKEVDLDFFKKGIFFTRNFADKYHHQKEEEILFAIMMEKLGPLATQLIRGGMMVEHDLGRLHAKTMIAAVEDLEKDPSNSDAKLELISNAVCYGDLLARHIDKENAAVYQFAIRSLDADSVKKVNEETLTHEDNEDNKAVLKICMGYLAELKEKING